MLDITDLNHNNHLKKKIKYIEKERRGDNQMMGTVSLRKRCLVRVMVYWT